MNQGIVVTTWSGGEKPCKRLIESIWTTPYPVAFVINDAQNTSLDWWKTLYALTGEMDWHVFPQDFDGFEIGAIEKVLTETNWDEFILLQDTIEIKNVEIFRILFEDFAGYSVAYNPHFQMYLGKYKREILNKLTLPIVRDKIEAVRQEELFTREYWKIDPSTKVFNPHFRDENFYNNWDNEFDRRNLKMEDDYIIKRKATWSADQLKAVN